MVEIENHYLKAELYKPEVKITYSYDQLGNRKSLHLSGLDTPIHLNYDYNQMDQLTSISDGNLGEDTIGLSLAHQEK